MSKISGGLACLCFLLGAGSGHATGLQATGHGALPASGTDDALPTEWVSVSDHYLDTLRGGFDIGQRLRLSFGIERSVTINGQLVSQVQFNLPDVTRIQADTAKSVSDALAAAGIVLQNGPGNQVANNTGIAGTTAPLVIQNSLNDQSISSRTVINTSVNSMSLFKAGNFQIGLKDALLGSLLNR